MNTFYNEFSRLRNAMLEKKRDEEFHLSPVADFAYTVNHSFMHFIHSFIHSFICSFMHSCVLLQTLKIFYDTYVDEHRHAVIKLLLRENVDHMGDIADEGKKWFFQWAQMYLKSMHLFEQQ
jgi:hypothetical protein